MNDLLIKQKKLIEAYIIILQDRIKSTDFYFNNRKRKKELQEYRLLLSMIQDRIEDE